MKVTFRLILLSMLVSLTTLLAGCGESGPPTIKSVVMGQDYKNGEGVVNQTTEFKTTDKLLYCVATIGGNPEGAKVRFLWSTVDTGGALGAEGKFAEVSVTLTKDQNVATSNFKPNQDMPAGKYKVEVFLNDQLANTANFTIV